VAKATRFFSSRKLAVLAVQLHVARPQQFRFRFSRKSLQLRELIMGSELRYALREIAIQASLRLFRALDPCLSVIYHPRRLERTWR
jgi:hypothetical protein